MKKEIEDGCPKLQQFLRKYIQNKEVYIEETLNFCGEVTSCLIKNLNKEHCLNLKIQNKTQFQTFQTGEWKLKQNLLNLLSNSVKFTNSGEICLDVH